METEGYAVITKSQRTALLLAATAVVATVVMPPRKYVGHPVLLVMQDANGQPPCGVCRVLLETLR